MIHATFKLDARPVLRVLEKMKRNVPQVIRSAFEEIAVEQVQRVEGRLSDKQIRLKRSLQVSRPDLRGAMPVLRIGSPLVYAAITHFGGTVQTFEQRGLSPTPDAARRRVFGTKPIKWLTVPLTRLGVPKYARARDYQQVFVWKNPKNGKLYLAQRPTEASDVKKKKARRGFANRNSRGLDALKKRKMRLLFALVDRTVIQAQPYLYWADADVGFAGRVLVRHMREALKD